MYGIPVLKSKLTMPELSESFLLTERLKRLHKNMESGRVVTVCAPAGYGKTNLAVSYLKCQEAEATRVCWYRLDDEDKNLSVFLAHLSDVVFPSDIPKYAESRKSLEENTDIQLQPKNAISLICREMWKHHDRNSLFRTYIVLDDFQNVAQIEEICVMTRYMLDHLPPSFALILLTRASLTVFTEKQKLDNLIKEINADELAFSNTEIEALIFSMGQVTIDSELVDFINKSTEKCIL